MLPIKLLGFTITRGDEPALVESDLSPAQELAIMQNRYAAREQLQTISWSRMVGMAVLILVMVISYSEQRQFMLDHHTAPLGARLIPVVFDLATIYFVMVIGAKAMRLAAVYTSVGLVLFPVSMSAFINFWAAPDSVMQIIQGSVSLLIPAIEIVRALMGADFARMRARESDAIKAAIGPLPKGSKTKAKKAEKRGGKRERVVELLDRNPGMTPKEIAAAAGISYPYASKLHRELKDELVEA